MITNFEIVGPYVAALMMSLGALCLFVWGIFSGAFHGSDEAALRFFEREVGNDGSAKERPGKPDASKTGSA